MDPSSAPLPVPASNTELSATDEVASLTRRVADASSRAAELAARDDDVDTAGMSPVQRRDLLNARRSELDAAREELAASTKQLQAAFEAQLAQVRAELAPLQERANAMMSTVEAISLYLGSDEQVVLLRDGDGAAASEPITVYQDVLFMDEEMALAAEAAGIADATIDPGEAGWATFDEWLLADDRHVDQVCPTRRGVVALRSAREQRKSTRFGETDGSEVTHFLIRNGDCLAWVIASFEFEVGARLIPARDEFDQFFVDRWARNADGSKARLQPGSADWDRAQAAADARQRHFMKIALILQGIVDRSTLLSPLPADDVSFVTPSSYDAGHIVAVVSDDGSQLPSGVVAFPQFRAAIAAELEVGQRVVFGTIPWSELHPDRDSGPSVVSPRNANPPERGVPYTVKRRRGDGRFAVSYRRTDEVWRRNVAVPDQPGYVYRGLTLTEAKGYASVTFDAECNWVLPIDHPLVTAEALEWYLLSRENRRHFRSMVPLLRSALRVLRAEETEEAPFRELAAAEAVRRFSVGEHRAVELVDSAIHLFKTKRREHRALLSGTDDGDAAFVAVLDLVAQRVALDELVDDPAVLARIDADHPDAMWVGRRGDGTYVALVPADERDVYVHRYDYTAAKGRPRPSREWIVAPDVRPMRAIRSTGRFESWPTYVDTSGEATGPELGQLVDLLRAEEPALVAIDCYKFWSFDVGSAVALRTWAPDADATLDADAPLTGTSTPGTFRTRHFMWRRDTDGLSVTERTSWGADRSVRVTSRSTPGLVDPLLVDPAFTSEWERRAEVWAEHERTVRPLSARRDAIMDAVAAAWEERAVAAEWAKFVEKFGAESTGRWETRRTAVAHRLRFPYRRDDALFDAVSTLAEACVDVDGRRVAELFDEAAELAEQVSDEVRADLCDLVVTVAPTTGDIDDTDEDIDAELDGEFT